MVYLAKTYASRHPQMKKGEGCDGTLFSDGIVNGAHWYDVVGMFLCSLYSVYSFLWIALIHQMYHLSLALGGMQDFNYVYSNCFEITLELGCCKFSSSNLLLKEWDLNRESMYAYMEQTHLGVKGMHMEESLSCVFRWWPSSKNRFFHSE